MTGRHTGGGRVLAGAPSTWWLPPATTDTWPRPGPDQAPTDPVPRLPSTWSLALAGLADPFAPACPLPHRRAARRRPPVRHGRLRGWRRRLPLPDDLDTIGSAGPGGDAPVSSGERVAREPS